MGHIYRDVIPLQGHIYTAIVIFYLFMVPPCETGVNLFTITSLTTKQNVYYQRL